MATTVVQVHDVSKRFVIHKDKSLKERLVNFNRSRAHKDDFWALRNVDFEIEAGTSVGLVGPNGSGKSTLLKTIGGIIQPTSGSVSLRGRLAALLELGAGFHPDLTGRENVFLNASILGLSKQQTTGYFDQIVDFSGIEQFIDTQVKFYSSGMYVRLAFAVAVHVDPDILLVDEVLAVGDEPFQRKCMDRIRRFQHEGRTIILVTHSLDQVTELCDRAVVLEHGRVKADGLPKDALRVLRDDFDATRREDVAREMQSVAVAVAAASAAADEDVLADGDEGAPPVAPPVAEVVSIAAGCGSGELAQHVTLEPGEDLRVRVAVRTDIALDDWYVGIAVNTPLGQSIYGTNTKLLGQHMPTLRGEREVEFVLPRFSLGEGDYSIDAALSLATGLEAHRLREGARITVDGLGRSVGFIHADPQLVI